MGSGESSQARVLVILRILVFVMDPRLHAGYLKKFPDVYRIFPYSTMRQAQVEMVGVVREAIEKARPAVVEGPTGMGKTIAVLCAVLSSSYAEGKKIVYCSRTHGQMDRVIEELRVLSSKLSVSGISLRGRREMCLDQMLKRSTFTAGEAARTCVVMKKLGRCEFFNQMMADTRGVERLVSELTGQQVSAGELKRICKAKGFCPYQIARLLLPAAKVVACSYVYIFDPDIRQSFLKSLQVELGDIILILDEAHNLPEVAVELASAELTSNSILHSRKEAEESGDTSALALVGALEELLEDFARSSGDEGERVVKGQDLRNVLSREFEKRGFEFIQAGEYLEEAGEKVLVRRISEGKTPRSFLRRTGRFLSMLNNTAKREEFIHVFSLRQDKKGKLIPTLEIQAIDPRLLTTSIFTSVYRVVSMSGTLSPLGAYVNVSGLPENSIKLQCSSPFLEKNILVLATRGVTTKEEHRTPKMYQKIVERLVEVVDSTPANIGVFTASYGVLQGLLDAGIERAISKPLFVEEKEASSEKNDRLVRKFKSFARIGGAVLLGVMGGRNAEGGDYPGHEMDSVVAVGVPYAPPTRRLEATMEYWETQFPGAGRFYGYYLPAHRRLAQAAGRAHRLITDKAAIILMDERVLSPFIRRSLPRWISRRVEVTEDERGALASKLGEFFGEKDIH